MLTKRRFPEPRLLDNSTIHNARNITVTMIGKMKCMDVGAIRELFIYGRGTAFLLMGECKGWTYQSGRCSPSCSQAGNETDGWIPDPIYTGQ